MYFPCEIYKNRFETSVTLKYAKKYLIYNKISSLLNFCLCSLCTSVENQERILLQKYKDVTAYRKTSP